MANRDFTICVDTLYTYTIASIHPHSNLFIIFWDIAWLMHCQSLVIQLNWAETLIAKPLDCAQVNQYTALLNFYGILKNEEFVWSWERVHNGLSVKNGIVCKFYITIPFFKASIFILLKQFTSKHSHFLWMNDKHLWSDECIEYAS